MIKKISALLLILFFNAQNHLLAQTGSGTNQSSSVNTTTTLQPKKVHFLITTKSGSLIGLTAKLKFAFDTPKFNSVDVLEKRSIIKIVSYKGTKIEDVKAILVSFNIGIIDYSEEYTNSATPLIFSNH